MCSGRSPWPCGPSAEIASPRRKARGSRGGPGSPGDVMGRPYLNVIRMHLLIFFFAACHAMKVDTFVVYAIVSLVYFFPWREVTGIRRDGAP